MAMDEEFPEVERWRAAGRRVALATVVSAYGSAPRGVGSHMVVADSGEFAGSVSGGCVENDVVEHARQVLDENAARLVPYGISNDQAFEVGLACGGQIEVFVQPLQDDPARNQPRAEVSVIKGEGLGLSMVVSESGRRTGTLGRGEALDTQVAADALRLLHAAKPGRRSYTGPDGAEFEVFVDVFPPPAQIVIFGGVHIGVALAKLAPPIGFRVVVVDPRGAWANDERFPSVDELYEMRADEYLAAHPLTSQSFVAVLSHDPKLDDPAIVGALPSPARYVGAVGSPKTQRERRERLRAAGLTDEQLDRLHGPIGLSIGARTPEEIAIAILAEMIQEKNREPAERPLAAALA